MEVAIFETNTVELRAFASPGPGAGCAARGRGPDCRGHVGGGHQRYRKAVGVFRVEECACQKWLVALEQLSRNTGAGIRFTDIRPGWTDTLCSRPGDRYPLGMTLDYAVPGDYRRRLCVRRVAVI